MKIIIGVIIFSIAFSSYGILYADQTYQVETSIGTKTVVVPDGMSELDVLLYLAKFYYELDNEYQSLLISSKELAKNVETYIAENKSLREKCDELVAKYQILTKDYEELAKVNPLQGLFGLEITLRDNINIRDLSGLFGGLLWERVGVYMKVGVDFDTQKVSSGLGALVRF